MRTNDKKKVRDHYDRVSPYYRELWGEHLHHGYWIRGTESKEEAQRQLVEHVAAAARIKPRSAVLDAGCGFGGSSILLAKRYGAEPTGITISPVQVAMANKAAAAEHVNAKFLLMDAEAMRFEKLFDVVWSMESISHYQEKERFWASAARFLKAKGLVAITDWFRREGLSQNESQKYIRPIEEGMMVELDTMSDYERWMSAHGLQVVRREILNEQVAKTWDIGLEIIRKKALWKLAAENGAEFVKFLRAFRAMRAGYASGNFVYGLLVAQKL